MNHFFRVLLGLVLWVFLFMGASLDAAIVGTTKGEFSVNQGTANYSLKIEVPPGIAGMEPKLSLNYSSKGGNGYMGIGWNLGGVSAITRCPQTEAVDGVNHKFGVKYDENDRFCLDGQRLIVVKGVYGTDASEYKTEIDTYSKIKQRGVYGSDKGPNYFEVKTKSGLTYRYGRYGGTDGNESAYLVINKRKVFWKVNDITDSYGNRIIFHYKNNYSTGENYLDKVTYADNTVDYIYETRVDKALGYNGGHQMSMTVRLKEVIVKTGSTEVRRYKVAYTNEASGAKRSKVASITEHVPEGDLKKLELAYTVDKKGFISNGTFSSDYRDSHYFADLNGDGFQDYIQDTKYDMHIYINNGNKTFSKIKTISQRKVSQLEFGDFNGDGMVDFLYSYGDYVYIVLNLGDKKFSAPKRYTWDSSYYDRKYPSESDNHDSGRVAPNANYMVADFNGDGISDVLFKRYYKTGSNYFFRDFKSETTIMIGSESSHFGKKIIARNAKDSELIGQGYERKYTGFTVADFNSDGLPDILHTISGKIALNNGMMDFTMVDSGLPKSMIGKVETVDFNGDGTPDIYQRYYDDDGLEAVWLNNGKGKFTFMYTIDVDGKNSDPIFIDVNGDGYTDIYWYYFKGTDKVFLNDGKGYFGFAYTFSPNDYLSFADINGDGLTDLVETRSAGKIWLNQAKQPLLIRITNKTDQDIQISYKNMTDRTIYHNYSLHGKRNAYGFNQLSKGNIELTTTQPLVYSVNSANGTESKAGKSPTAGYNQQHYFYYGYVVNKLRGSQGFHAIHTYDDTSRTRTTDYYKQIGLKNGSDDMDGFQFTGMPYASYVLDQTDNKYLQKTILTYKDASSRSKVYEPYTYANTEIVYDPDSKAEIKKVYHNNHISTDGYGNVVKTVDRTEDKVNGKDFNKTTTNEYKAENPSKWYLGRLTKATVVHSQTDGHTVSRSSTFKYNSRGILSEEVVNAGTSLALKKTYAYDGHGNKIKETISGTGVQTATTTYGYSSTYKGKFQTFVKDAAGYTISRDYNPSFGTVTKLTDANGLVSSWKYDGLGRKIYEKRPDGTVSTWTHKWYGTGLNSRFVYFVVQTASGMPSSNTYYDSLGRETTAFHATLGGKRLRTSLKYYNPKGELIKEALPYIEGKGAVGYIFNTYDNYGRVTKVIKPGPSGTMQTFQTIYKNFTTVVTDPKGVRKQIVKNAAGQTLKVTDAYGTSLASSVSYSYDAAGNLLSTTDAAGNIVTMQYDSAGNKEYMKDPDMGEWHYLYNAAGKLTKQWSGDAGYDGSEHATYKTYDVLGRLVRTNTHNRIEYLANKKAYDYNYKTYTYGASSAAAGSRGKLVEAYASSKILKGDQQREKKTYAYDTLGRQESVNTYIYGRGDYLVSTTYDSYSRPSTVTYPNGYKVTNHYNSGILDYIRGSDGKIHYRVDELHAMGSISRGHFANGVYEARLSDNAGFIGTVESGHGKSSLGDVQRIDYTYDTLGNVLEREDNSMSKGIVDTFTYDALNRLYSQRTVSSISGSYAKAKNYRYDKIGNITYQTGIGSYAYKNGRPHAVSKAGSRTYRYDAVGNMTYRNGDTIVYNPLSKPAIMTNGKTKDEIRFYYGVGGARFMKRTAYKDTYYIGKLYEERDDGNGNIEQIAYLSLGGKTVGTHTEKFNTGFNDPKTKYNHYFHTDALGSITAITDDKGKVIERRSYEPFGKIRTMDYGTNNNRYANTVIDSTRAFTGHEQIAELSGLIHMNARVYDSDIGRFLSADTMIQYPNHSQGYNRYSYIENNPLMAPDPSGHGFFSFLGSIFKAIFNNIRTIASIVVAAIVVAVVGPWVTTTFSLGMFGTAVITGAIAGFASTLVATGSLGAALKGAFWGAISAGMAYGIGHGIQALQKLYANSSRMAAAFYKALAHGLSRAMIRLVQGGKALGGFLSGFAGSLLGGFAKGLKNVDPTIKTIIVAIAGGTASVLGGGKFANGAMSAAFIFMFNEMAGPTKEKAMAIKALKAIYNKSLEAGKEMGGFIYKLADGSYGYLHAGTNALSDHLELNPKLYSFPSGATIVATYHTHPSLYNEDGYLLDTEIFSEKDYSYGIRYNVDMYLATLGGTFAYTDNNGNQANINNFFR